MVCVVVCVVCGVVCGVVWCVCAVRVCVWCVRVCGVLVHYMLSSLTSPNRCTWNLLRFIINSELNMTISFTQWLA